MHINLSKDKFTAIDGAFLVLKEDPQSQAALKIIKDSLESCFNKTFIVTIVQTAPSSMFVMSVLPEISTTDKVISAVLSNKETDAIQKLWEANKVWTIEIDSNVLNDNIINLSNRELTAGLLHEVGHITCSTSIPNRVSLIMRYELAKASLNTKMLLKDSIFSNILSLPVLNACISDSKRDKSSIKEEIKADKFASKMGYTKELSSMLTKLMENKKYPNSGSINDNMKKITDYSLKTLDDFQSRKDKLAKSSLLSLKEGCSSPFIESVIDNIVDTIFEDSKTSKSIINGRKVEIMIERAERDIEEGCVMEFFIFGGKQLKRIDPAELDYINVKINEIRSETDKMMLVSYIHSKLDMVEYYMSIVSDPTLSRKYIVPHTYEQLISMKKRLLNSRDLVLKYKIPERNKHILVAYPKGYEG